MMIASSEDGKNSQHKERDMAKRKTQISASLLAIALATPAFGQTTDPQSERRSEQDDEIIVTATLRSENLQDVPIAVTAYSTETLEKSGVKDLRDLGSGPIDLS